MKTIMVATDFSERSDRALRRATLLARQFDASMTLIHVVDDDQPAGIVESEHAAAARLLHTLSETLRDVDGVRCDTRLIHAAPFVGIDQASRDCAPDLLVIGSHRRQLLRDLFLGTTAERTIHSVSCPVLMVNAPPAGAYRHVMLTTDLSTRSRSTIERFASLKMSGPTRTAVLHVFDAPALGLATRRAIPKHERDHYVAAVREEASLQLSGFLAGCDLTLAELMVRQNTDGASNEILAAAGDAAVDLVVIGTQGKSGLAKWLIGSVAQDVLRRAPMDVLAIPPKREE